MGNCDEVPRAYPMFSQTTDASQMPWSKDRTSAGKNPSQPLNSEPVLSFFDYKKKKMHESTDERFEGYESLNYNFNSKHLFSSI